GVPECEPFREASQGAGARDDFLARIATLAEADTAQRVEVEHLRNELILRRRQDHRHAGADRQPAPTRKSRGTSAGKSIPERRGFGRHDRGDEERTRQRSDRYDVICYRVITRWCISNGYRNALVYYGTTDKLAPR